ncbi:hypothetical protein CMI47_10220 [Candidatus Pacearchaeota archaeon]|nr:hypothetical protein [Candidatus Pacearchaeota archaeon]|tara:strand:- start:11427 stop:11831 length:405 start_codon:yes stop_codon:yes gene_type:complete
MDENTENRPTRPRPQEGLPPQRKNIIDILMDIASRMNEYSIEELKGEIQYRSIQWNDRCRCVELQFVELDGEESSEGGYPKVLMFGAGFFHPKPEQKGIPLVRLEVRDENGELFESAVVQSFIPFLAKLVYMAG